jgi:hypothetical protein
VTACLKSLRDNDVYTCLRRSSGFFNRSDLMNHQRACVMGALDIGRRITPEKRQSRNLFLQSCGNPVLDRKVQQEIYAKRLVGKIPDLAYFLAQSGRRGELRLQYAEGTGIGHGGHQIGAGHIRTHRSRDDRMIDSQQSCDASSHAHDPFFFCCRKATTNRRRLSTRSDWLEGERRPCRCDAPSAPYAA